MNFRIFLYIAILSVIVGCNDEPSKLVQSTSSPDFFDVQIGQRFPTEPNFNSENQSIPVWSIRVPLPENSEINFIKDFSVNIDKVSEVVSGIGFERAFNTLPQCVDALNIVKTQANDRLGFELGENVSAPLSGRVQDIEADAHCGFQDGSPYHSLYVSFRSVSIFEKQRKKFEKLTNH